VLKKDLPITFEALTPIWTGDWSRKSDTRILETGILGSLRWWTEILVRGMGVAVEDPAESGHVYDDPTCLGDPVERLFGFTGWRRRFRLEVDGHASLRPEGRYALTDPPVPWAPGKDRPPTWQFPSTAHDGATTLRLIGASDKDAAIIQGALAFAAAVGALGAKSQHGCGIIRYEMPAPALFLEWLAGLWKAGGGGAVNPGLPSLRDLFVGEYTADRIRDVDTFYARYNMRATFRSTEGATSGEIVRQTAIRHAIFGSLGNDRQGSKVCVSFPFEADGARRIRVWGWLPQSPTRASHLAGIRAAMEHHFTASRWLDLADWYPSSVLPEIAETLQKGVPWTTK
jgi:CRISPR-associated protein Cmr1